MASPKTARAFSGKRSIFVSYAWGDDSSEAARQRELVVDGLCRKLEAESWEVVRDKTAMRMGDEISAFMQRITHGDLVVVVLSAKYLRSPYCMAELYGLFQSVQGDKQEFLDRVIPLTLDDAKFSSWRDRVVFAEHWQSEFKEMEKSFRHLGGQDFQLYKSVKDWHNHVGDMLAYVNDRLHPHGFEQIVRDDFAGLMQMLGGQDVRAGVEEERRYLARLIADIEAKARLYSPLAGVARVRPNLTALDPWKDEPGIELLIKHQTRKREMEEQGPGDDYDDILTAFKKVERAALLGAPGSGKSTTLRKLALELAHQALADKTAPLPVLVSLGEWIGDEPLGEFLTMRAPEVGANAEVLAKAGRLVLLLDGLNEMPTAKRAKKAADIRAFCAKLQKINANTAIVGSCRKEDYAGDLDLGLDTLTLEPLSPQRIRAALRQWVVERGQPVETAERVFWQLAGDERLAGVFEKWRAAGSGEAFWKASSPQDEKEVYAETSGEEDRLWTEHIPNPRSLLKLAANPFMLTMLFQVWVAEGQLPKNRGDLFNRFIDRLLHREGLLVKNAETQTWQLTRDGELLLKGLADLAWQMQRKSVVTEAEDETFGVLTTVPRADALEALPSPTLMKIALDATLLEGTDELRFRHQLLQEYFTAKSLQDAMERTQAEELWPVERWWERTGWEEAAVLLAGFHAGDCSKIIRWLAEAQPEVAAQCVAESGASLANEAALFKELQRAWLPRLTDVKREPAHEARAAVGRALGRLALDNRKGVGLRADALPDIDWVEIAGGEFVYQEGERRKAEAFQMARYPVTNAQFQAFVDAKDGYADDRWWRGLDKPDRTPRAGAWREGNHPRETVSWYEAMAFCAWLGYRLKLDVRLPTEWQWERAARGRYGREFPWGKEYVAGYANINETYQKAGPHSLARTSPVGIYPQGGSLDEKVLDLAGNVWEWCLNEYKNPERIQAGGTGSRVLRGGSWRYDPDFARAQARNDDGPGSRSFSFGFRVVAVLSPMKN